MASTCGMSPNLRCLLVLYSVITAVYGLKMISSHFPNHVIRGHSLNLTCDYDPEGGTIYQVKWYKEDEEFYSYAPDRPSRTYDVAGVRIDLEQSGSSSVVLSGADRDTEGTYTCEVTIDGTFDTKVERGRVQVVELPQRGPEISGVFSDSMDADEMVQLNCTSYLSRPAAYLSWFINGARPDNGSLIRYDETVSASGLRTTILGLRLRLRESHFRAAGVLTLKCTSQIEAIYYNSADRRIYSRAQARRAPNDAACLRQSWPVLSFLSCIISSRIYFIG